MRSFNSFLLLATAVLAIGCGHRPHIVPVQNAVFRSGPVELERLTENREATVVLIYRIDGKPVEASGVIVTPRHVLAAPSEYASKATDITVKITAADGQIYMVAADHARTNPDYNVSLIQTKEVMPIKPVAWNLNLPRSGDAIYTVDNFGGGMIGMIHRGHVTFVEGSPESIRHFVFEALTSHASVGCGVYNSRGELIGILLSTPLAGHPNAPIGQAVASYELWRFMKVQKRLAPADGPPAKPQAPSPKPQTEEKPVQKPPHRNGAGFLFLPHDRQPFKVSLDRTDGDGDGVRPAGRRGHGADDADQAAVLVEERAAASARVGAHIEDEHLRAGRVRSPRPVHVPAVHQGGRQDVQDREPGVHGLAFGENRVVTELDGRRKIGVNPDEGDVVPLVGGDDLALVAGQDVVFDGADLEDGRDQPTVLVAVHGLDDVMVGHDQTIIDHDPGTEPAGLSGGGTDHDGRVLVDLVPHIGGTHRRMNRDARARTTHHRQQKSREEGVFGMTHGAPSFRY